MCPRPRKRLNAQEQAETAARRAYQSKLPKVPAVQKCGKHVDDGASAIEGLIEDFEDNVAKIGKQAYHAAIRAAEEGCLFQRELFPFRSGLLRTKVDRKAAKIPNSLKKLTNVKKHIIGLAKSLRAPGHPLREFTFSSACHRGHPDRDPGLLLMSWIEYCAVDAFALDGSPGPLKFRRWKRRALPPAVAPLYALVGQAPLSSSAVLCRDPVRVVPSRRVEALSSYITRLTVSAARALARASQKLSALARRQVVRRWRSA